jgi:hypothetical protein
MKDMEYQQLILNGYMNHRKYLVNHYTREAKKANDNDIPQDEFITRCRVVLGTWEADLKRQLNERKKELQQIALLDKSMNEYCKNELANLTLDSFTVYLPAFTNNQLIGYLTINDIKELQKAIDSIQDRTKKKGTPSYTTFGMALHMSGTIIDKKCVGVNDGIDYAKKFELTSPITLYNRWNDILNEKLANPEKIEAKAKEIIKKYKL